MPEISVIIPLYNKAPHIARTLTSVLAQTYQDFEVIVVDDGSTDNSAEVVLEFDDARIQLIRQENQGVSAARNRGASTADGELLAFLDADDEWFPHHLETIKQLQKKFPLAGAFSTSYIIIDENGQIRDPRYGAIPPSPWEGYLSNYFLSAITGESPINSSTFCIKKEVFSNLGGYPLGVPYKEDADLWGRIAISYPIAFSWVKGAIYHWDSTNRASMAYPSIQKDEFVFSAQDAIRRNIVPLSIMDDLIEYVHILEMDRAENCIMIGRPREARRILASSRTKRFRKRKFIMFILAVIPGFLFEKIWHTKRCVSQILFNTDYSNDPWFKSDKRKNG